MDKKYYWSLKNYTNAKNFIYLIFIVFNLGAIISTSYHQSINSLFIQFILLTFAFLLLPFMIGQNDFFHKQRSPNQENKEKTKINIYGNDYSRNDDEEEERSLRLYGNHKLVQKRILLNMLYILVSIGLFFSQNQITSEYHGGTVLIGILILNSKSFLQLYLPLFVQIIINSVYFKSSSLYQISLIVLYFTSILLTFHLSSLIEMNFSTIKKGKNLYKKIMTNITKVFFPLLICSLISYFFFYYIDVNIPKLFKKDETYTSKSKTNQSEMIKLLAENVLNKNIPLDKVPPQFMKEVIELTTKMRINPKIEKKNIKQVGTKKERTQTNNTITINNLQQELPSLKDQMIKLQGDISQFKNLNYKELQHIPLDKVHSVITQNVMKVEDLEKKLKMNPQDIKSLDSLTNELKDVQNDLAFSMDQFKYFQHSQQDYFNRLDDIGNDLSKYSENKIDPRYLLPRDKENLSKLKTAIHELSKETQKIDGFDPDIKKNLQNILQQGTNEITKLEKDKTPLPPPFLDQFKDKITTIKNKQMTKSFQQDLDKIQQHQDMVNSNIFKINQYIKNVKQEQTQHNDIRNIDIKGDSNEVINEAPKSVKIADLPQEIKPLFEKNQPEQKQEKKTNEFPFKKLFKALLLFAIIIFIKKLFFSKKRKNLKSTVDREQFRKLTSIYKNIVASSKSPREEVLESYYLVHHLIEDRHFEEFNQKAPPPSRLNQIWNETAQPYEQSFTALTETYCEVLYGNKTISKEHVKRFRKHFLKIWKVLQMGRESFSSN